jgi:hypothetical protein
MKTINLPRQAWDKHRKSGEKGGGFCRSRSNAGRWRFLLAADVQGMPDIAYEGALLIVISRLSAFLRDGSLC